MKREDGFYWVKYDGSWEVARYNKCSKSYGFWDVIGSEDQFYDEAFEQIGEQIKKPDE